MTPARRGAHGTRGAAQGPGRHGLHAYVRPWVGGGGGTARGGPGGHPGSQAGDAIVPAAPEVVFRDPEGQVWDLSVRLPSRFDPMAYKWDTRLAISGHWPAARLLKTEGCLHRSCTEGFTLLKGPFGRG